LAESIVIIHFAAVCNFVSSFQVDISKLSIHSKLRLPTNITVFTATQAQTFYFAHIKCSYYSPNIFLGIIVTNIIYYLLRYNNR